jgi:hypothetical protein
LSLNNQNGNIPHGRNAYTIPNEHKMDQQFPFQGPPKFTKIFTKNSFFKNQASDLNLKWILEETTLLEKLL